ncbi:NAD-dependent epimerase/dehydratase family protein [Pollutibacter soli]|uniref:NAD-dependent epimerase/dehydratase family protein n=1 Tax=Pollutibacter soli TaxID=3034157 RepID=UPI0030140303
MSRSRRRFLQNALGIGGILPFMDAAAFPGTNTFKANEIPHRPQPLKILILGGTGFLGPQQIAYALERGHAITTFNRGKTVPTTQKDVFNHVEQLLGDRENNLESLKNRKWDAIIDNSGNKVKWVIDTAQLLKDSADFYLYTSSTGVYYPYLGSDIKENTKAVLTLPPGLKEPQLSEYSYGVMKINSELEVQKAFGEKRSIIVRPTYMMGPGDRTERFIYWPVRLSRGGDVMVPGKATDPVQYIDVRDVANWMIRLIEEKKAGTYNAVGPSSPTTMHPFVYGAHAAFSSPANFIAVNDYNFLKAEKIMEVIPWIMPVDENKGSALINNQLAMANGLALTPLADSVRDMFDWWNSDDVKQERRDKLVSGTDALMAREKEILAKWKSRKK